LLHDLSAFSFHDPPNDLEFMMNLLVIG